MIDKFIRIETGMLLKVERTFWTDAKHLGSSYFNKVKLPKGAIIEIRYPFAWNFRDERDEYSHCSPEKLIKNCSFFGNIHGDISFKNKLKLRDILKHNHYHSAEDFELKLKAGH